MFSPTRKEGGSLFHFVDQKDPISSSGKPILREPIFFPEMKNDSSQKKLEIELSSSVPPTVSKMLK